MPPPLVTLNDCRQYVEQLLFPPFEHSPTGKPGSIGIELENFPYQITDQRSSPVSLYGNDSLVNALLSVSGTYGGRAKHSKPDKNGIAKIVKIEFPDGDGFLFEPGGQVEISTAPCENITSLEEHLLSKQHILDAVTQLRNIHFGQHGTNPWFDGNMIGNQLMATRYIALENYFNTVGPYGRQMMLQTCGLHINLDLGSDDSMRIKRIIAANLLVPFATALFANSPNIAGKKTAYKTYRSYIWQHADNLRTGILPVHQILKTMDREALIDMYLDFGLSAPLIFIPELGEHTLPISYTLKYWLDHPIDGIRPDQAHLENHFSLLFPEVRLKGYLELRSVDAPPSDWQMVPVFFYAGLLYSDLHVDKTLELLSPFAPELDRLFEQATAGLESDQVFSLSKKLMQLAIEGFASLPGEFRLESHKNHLFNFYERFTLQRRTFADEFGFN